MVGPTSASENPTCFRRFYRRVGTMEQPSMKASRKDSLMNSIIYIVGLVVVVIAVASFFGLR